MVLLSGAVGRSRTRGEAFKDWVNSPEVTGWFLVVVSVLCAVFAVVNYRAAAALRDFGVRVPATILQVHEGKDAYVVVKFTAVDGAEFTAEVGNFYWSPKPRVGGHATIIYDPDDPTGNVADARMGPDFFTVWCLVAGAVVAGLLVRPTFTGRIDWRKMAR